MVGMGLTLMDPGFRLLRRLPFWRLLAYVGWPDRPLVHPLANLDTKSRTDDLKRNSCS